MRAHCCGWSVRRLESSASIRHPAARETSASPVMTGSRFPPKTRTSRTSPRMNPKATDPRTIRPIWPRLGLPRPSVVFASSALSGTVSTAYSGVDVEAEHHAAFVVLGDVAVRHPQAGVRDVEQDVDGLAGTDQHGVLPDEALLGLAVSGQDQEPPR